MSAIDDEIKRATGSPTVPEGLASWFSKTATEDLMDAEARWLFSQLQVTVKANVSDMWSVYLKALGYTGALSDMMLQYWAAQPTPI